VTNGRLIDLGSTTDVAANTLELSNAELNTITSTFRITVGDANSGNITIMAPLNLITTGYVYLNSGGSISQNSGATITAANLANTAVGSIILNEANAVGIFGADSTGSGNAIQFTNAMAIALGNNANAGIHSTNGAITLVATTGGITITDTVTAFDVDAGTSTVTLTAGGVNQTLSVPGTVRGTGGVTYTAD